MRFVGEAPGLAEAQVGLMNECRCLESVPRSEAGPRTMRNPPQLLVKGRQQLGGNAADVCGRRACLQPNQRVLRQWVFFVSHLGDSRQIAAKPGRNFAHLDTRRLGRRRWRDLEWLPVLMEHEVPTQMAVDSGAASLLRARLLAGAPNGA